VSLLIVVVSLFGLLIVRVCIRVTNGESLGTLSVAKIVIALIVLLLISTIIKWGNLDTLTNIGFIAGVVALIGFLITKPSSPTISPMNLNVPVRVTIESSEHEAIYYRYHDQTNNELQYNKYTEPLFIKGPTTLVVYAKDIFVRSSFSQTNYNASIATPETIANVENLSQKDFKNCK